MITGECGIQETGPPPDVIMFNINYLVAKKETGTSQ
jgi:hypothetical protein